MQKTILSLFFIISFINVSNAQFGGRIAAEFASLEIDIDGFTEKLNHTGFAFGIFYGIQISKGIKVRPEINYLYFSKEKEANLKDQIYAPLLLEIGIVENFGLLLGPSATYWLNVDELKSLALGVNFGLYYGTGDMNFEVRYDLGITNMAEDVDSVFDISTKKNSIQLGINYAF